MKKIDNYENYLYYKGEKNNPYEDKDKGKSFWWRVEFYAFERKDKKEKDRLSPAMKTYLTEHHWDGDCQHDTTKELALQRATEMYRMGIWSANYVVIKAYKLEYAIDDSES